MFSATHGSYLASLAAKVRHDAAVCCAALALILAFSAVAQQPAPPPQTDNDAKPPAAADQPPLASPATPAPVGSEAATPTAPAAAQTPPAAVMAEEPGKTSEEELKRLLVGKAAYLRGGYLDNSLRFNEYGQLVGHSPQGSFTLSAIEISKVRLTKHKVELVGIRYGLHFVGQLASEDTATAFDRVRVTPKKKAVSITIDREIVVKPKKLKGDNADKEKDRKHREKTEKTKVVAPPVPESALGEGAGAQSAEAPSSAPTATPTTEPVELSAADQLKASIAAVPENERPADENSVTTTTSPAHAAKLLKDALDKIFALGLDDRMMAAMPEFWKHYYEAAAAKSDYRPKDPAILRQNTVDQKAVLLTKFEPESNEFAQANGVAGMALYHTVVGADGKTGEIAVGRPIGFGLDENAVAAIGKASFQPAVKDGKPVPVLLDLVVQFRIFSKRTNVHTEPEPADKPVEPVLPGPYSVQHQ